MNQIEKLINDMKEEIARNNHANFFLIQRAIETLGEVQTLLEDEGINYGGDDGYNKEEWDKMNRQNGEFLSTLKVQ